MTVAVRRFLLLLCWLLLDVATAQSHRAPPEKCTTVTHVVRSVEQLCGGSPVADSLQSVGVGDDGAAAAEKLLRRHGFRTVLDLRLLSAGGPEEAELMEQLRAEGISIGVRSKVRLLLGDDGSDPLSSSHDGGDRQYHSGGSDQASNIFDRQLQQDADKSMSMDTIAIVVSVLFGAGGYLIQAYTARRAEQSATSQEHERHLHEQTRQREHEQMLSQITRTDRWLDDCMRMRQILAMPLVVSCLTSLFDTASLTVW
eukprot:SAG31_NODE_222_length_19895_cov_34.907626_6_plen_256_part_00